MALKKKRAARKPAAEVPVRRIEPAESLVPERFFRDPFREIERLRRQMDRLFDERWPLTGRLPVFEEMPTLDVYQEADRVMVKAELPGMEKKDIEVSLDGDVLTVRGEKKKEEDVREGDYSYRERSYGSFTRSVRLPTEIDVDKVKATFKNGVLTMTLPKSRAARERARTVRVD